MNYIVLNGVKSNTIKGLLIQSLPTISKPKIRTEVEEIDGRDGDIVTKLGYSAYDKEMSIGLYGDFNIDDVIQYFDSEGTVTFSNEPDKYYKYQITEQIDFERLIRFRTATVVFHVQPFKYSAVETNFIFNNNFATVSDYSEKKNGITVTAKNGTVSVTGTGAVATEFYVPLKSQTIKGGNYTLSAEVTGTTGNVCSIRVIKSAPSNADSFGGNYLPLVSNGTALLTGSVADNTVYGYLWFYFNPKQQVNFTLDISLSNNAFNSVSVRNIGNYIARPSITLYGNGTVNLSINGMQLFTINLTDYITLDAISMNAYKGDLLANRSVTGDIDNLVFNVGTNIVSWTGNVTELEIANYSRWL